MSRRRSIHVEGQTHGAHPIPAASFKNGLLISSAIYGAAGGGAEPGNIDTQCERLFQTVAAILREAGGSLDDIVQMAVKLADPSDRAALNHHWVAAFPAADSRPARHVDAEPLRAGPRLIAVEFTAMIDDVEGVSRHGRLRRFRRRRGRTSCNRC